MYFAVQVYCTILFETEERKLLVRKVIPYLVPDSFFHSIEKIFVTCLLLALLLPLITFIVFTLPFTRPSPYQGILVGSSRLILFFFFRFHCCCLFCLILLYRSRCSNTSRERKKKVGAKFSCFILSYVCIVILLNNAG